MTLVSRSMEMLLDRDPVAARGSWLQLRELQREALAEMRALIFELRPGNLEQDGLVQALRTHTRRGPGPDRPAGRRRERPRRAPADRGRGGPVPDRPGGAAQRRQARGGARRSGSRSAGRRRRPFARRRRRQGLRSRTRPGRPPRAGRDARPGRADRRAGSLPESPPGTARRSRSIVLPTRRSSGRPALVRGSTWPAEWRDPRRDAVGRARRSAEDGPCAERPYRAAEPRRHRIDAMATDPRTAPALLRGSSSSIADDRVRESLAGLHRDRRRGRGRRDAGQVGRGAARSRGPPRRTSSSSTHACPMSERARVHPNDSAPPRPVVRILAMCAPRLPRRTRSGAAADGSCPQDVPPGRPARGDRWPTTRRPDVSWPRPRRSRPTRSSGETRERACRRSRLAPER